METEIEADGTEPEVVLRLGKDIDMKKRLIAYIEELHDGATP